MGASTSCRRNRSHPDQVAASRAPIPPILQSMSHRWAPKSPAQLQHEHISLVASLVEDSSSGNGTRLDLSSKQLTGADVRKILAAVKDPESVTCLDVALNKIGAEGAEAISEFLRTANFVTKLDMRTNGITNRGLEHLLQALSDNETLTELDLRRNGFDNDGAALIASLLESNQSITRLDLRHNYGITSHGKDLLLAAVKRGGVTADIVLEDAGSQCRLAAALEENRAKALVLTVLWDPPSDGVVLIRCFTMGGEEAASETLAVSDTLASLRRRLVERLRLSQRLVFILPDASVLEDPTESATLNQLLNL